MMINTILCSILYSPNTSDNYEMNRGDYKPTHFEPTIKHLTKEKILGHRSERNLVRRVHNIRVKISIMKTFTMKAKIFHSIYNAITKQSREEIFDG